MSFPTRCCVWEKWDTMLLSPGRNKFSGIQKPIASANWIELMENPWSSSGRSSQDSQQRVVRITVWLNCSVNLSRSKVGSSSCECVIVWDAKGIDELCVNNSKTNEEYAERFPRGHWSFLGPGSEKKWYGTYDGKPNGSWDRIAEKMMQKFQRSGHPIFRCTIALERGQLRSKEGGKTTIHFNGSTEILGCSSRRSSPSITSVFTEQWRIWLQNFQFVRQLWGNPLHQVSWINKKFLHNVLSKNCKPMKSDRETYCKITSEDLKKLPEDQKLSKLCSEAGLRSSRSWTIILCSSVTKRRRESISMQRIYVASRSRRNSYQKGGSKAMYDLAQSRT